MTYTDRAIQALERALSRKEWREDGWEVPAIDAQEALDALKAEQLTANQKVGEGIV